MLLGVSAFCEERDIDLIGDESFIEFTTEPSLLTLATHRRRLLVVRSLTKSFALAGLRIAFLVAGRSRVEELAHRMEPWSVNTLALSAAAPSILEADYIQKARSLSAGTRVSLPGTFTIRLASSVSKQRELSPSSYPIEIHHGSGARTNAGGKKRADPRRLRFSRFRQPIPSIRGSPTPRKPPLAGRTRGDGQGLALTGGEERAVESRLKRHAQSIQVAVLSRRAWGRIPSRIKSSRRELRR